MSAPDWFSVCPVGGDIYSIAEPGHVNSYLVVGGDRALLFDTGMGIDSMLAAVRSVTDLPLVTVNSHHHFDHRGGNAELAEHGIEIVAHPAGLDLHDEAPAQWRAAYAEVAGRMAADFEQYAELDHRSFFLLSNAQRIRPVPDLADWRIPAVRPDRGAEDGEPIDLGGRTLRVLHTPGHSPDGLCLWDEETGTLLAGDTVLAAAFWAHFPESDIDVFSRTLARLAAMPIRRALVAHNLRTVLPGDAVAVAADAFAAVRDAGSVPVPSADPFGNPVCRHDFDGFAIFARAGR